MSDINLFLDMDGVLAKWQEDKTFEEVASPGYFATLPIVENMINAVKILDNIEYGPTLKILSAAFDDNHSRQDKKKWLSKHLPFIKDENIHFVNAGDDKGACIEKGKVNFLLDDKSSNLETFEKAGGIGIKCYNHCNGTKGTWTGYSIKNTMRPEIIAKQIVGIIVGNSLIL